MDKAPEEIAALVTQTLDRPLSSDIQAMAAHLAQRHGKAAAILAYGSCLRGVSTEESLIDLYVLMEREEDVSANWFSRLGARLVPPNVYYAETAHDGRTLRAKYAVMTLAAFALHVKPGTANPYFWARFAQPTALVHAANEDCRRRVIAAVADAVITMYRAGIASAPAGSATLDIWGRGFAETYRTELRPEAGDRAREIVSANAGFYEAVARPWERPMCRPYRGRNADLRARLSRSPGSSRRHSPSKVVLPMPPGRSSGIAAGRSRSRHGSSATRFSPVFCSCPSSCGWVQSNSCSPAIDCSLGKN